MTVLFGTWIIDWPELARSIIVGLTLIGLVLVPLRAYFDSARTALAGAFAVACTLTGGLFFMRSLTGYTAFAALAYPSDDWMAHVMPATASGVICLLWIALFSFVVPWAFESAASGTGPLSMLGRIGRLASAALLVYSVAFVVGPLPGWLDQYARREAEAHQLERSNLERQQRELLAKTIDAVCLGSANLQSQFEDAHPRWWEVRRHNKSQAQLNALLAATALPKVGDAGFMQSCRRAMQGSTFGQIAQYGERLHEIARQRGAPVTLDLKLGDPVKLPVPVRAATSTNADLAGYLGRSALAPMEQVRFALAGSDLVTALNLLLEGLLLMVAPILASVARE